LPNDRALEPQARNVYERFGLNARQIEILSTATPKRDYYAQTPRGNRLFELGLGPVALALTAVSSPDDQRLIDRCLAEGRDVLAAGFRPARALAGAAELRPRWPRPSATSAATPSAMIPIASAEGAPAVPAASPEGGAPSPTAAAPPPPRTDA